MVSPIDYCHCSVAVVVDNNRHSNCNHCSERDCSDSSVLAVLVAVVGHELLDNHDSGGTGGVRVVK